MKWHQMTPAQKSWARDIRNKLSAHDPSVEVSVSQVAAQWGHATKWAQGDMSLEKLLGETGWVSTSQEPLTGVELPVGVIRHVCEVLEKDGSEESVKALGFLRG